MKLFFDTHFVFTWVERFKNVQSQDCSILLGLEQPTSHMCYGDSNQNFLYANLALLQISDFIGRQKSFQQPLTFLSLGSIPARSRGYPNFDYISTSKSSLIDSKKSESSVEEFIKKSFAYRKSLRFQQCYFNPISCFRR